MKTITRMEQLKRLPLIEWVRFVIPNGRKQPLSLCCTVRFALDVAGVEPTQKQQEGIDALKKKYGIVALRGLAGMVSNREKIQSAEQINSPVIQGVLSVLWAGKNSKPKRNGPPVIGSLPSRRGSEVHTTRSRQVRPIVKV
jgi:hypothetical protein